MGVEEAATYAVPPMTKTKTEQQSGKYQRKLDKAYGFDYHDNELYPVPSPMRNHITGERETGTVWMKLPNESFSRELDENQDLIAKWQRGIQAEWVPAWETHHRVANASADERKWIFGFALFMDASKFQKRDSLLIMTCRLLCSGRRHLVFALPKSAFCDCGCSGWCTLYPIYHAIYWSLLSAINGTRPLRRHDGKPLDEARNDIAGAICRYIRGAGLQW